MKFKFLMLILLSLIAFNLKSAQKVDLKDYPKLAQFVDRFIKKPYLQQFNEALTQSSKESALREIIFDVKEAFKTNKDVSLLKEAAKFLKNVKSQINRINYELAKNTLNELSASRKAPSKKIDLAQYPKLAKFEDRLARKSYLQEFNEALTQGDMAEAVNNIIYSVRDSFEENKDEALLNEAINFLKEVKNQISKTDYVLANQILTELRASLKAAEKQREEKEKAQEVKPAAPALPLLPLTFVFPEGIETTLEKQYKDNPQAEPFDVIDHKKTINVPLTKNQQLLNNISIEGIKVSPSVVKTEKIFIYVPQEIDAVITPLYLGQRRGDHQMKTIQLKKGKQETLEQEKNGRKIIPIDLFFDGYTLGQISVAWIKN